jgi:hypothetical protein
MHHVTDKFWPGLCLVYIVEYLNLINRLLNADYSELPMQFEDYALTNLVFEMRSRLSLYLWLLESQAAMYSKWYTVLYIWA